MASGKGRRGPSRRKYVVVGVLAGTGVALGLGVSAATAAGPLAYRTAVVTVSSVDQTLSVTGTLEPVTEAGADFQVSGTVASVKVTKGEEVTAGEAIASIDPTSLEATLTEARDNLNSAEAKLTEDELNESSSSSATSDGSSPTGSTEGNEATASTTASSTGSPAAAVLTSALTSTGTASSGSMGSGGSTGSRSGSSITQYQQVVVADQHTVDTDLEAAAVDLVAMEKACASSGPTTAPTSTSTTSTTSTTTDNSGTATTSVPASGTGLDSSTISACAAALASASSAEQQVSTDQNRLAAAETTLATALTAEAGSSTGSSQSTPTSTSSGTNSGAATQHSSASGTESAASSTKSTSVDTDTPQQLASDEATIDNDMATVVNAQQSLDAATLVSPVTGTVESVDIAAGDSINAGSSSQAITIVDWNTYQASASLTTSQAEDVKVGQSAQVTVDGISGTLAARVTRVGPVQDSDSSYTYPVVATITSSTGQLAAGSTSHMVIDISQADNTTVVPTSAVHTTNTGSYVYLDRNGTEIRQTVKTGLVSDVYTQITAGLSGGEVVVLADPSQAVPSSSTNTNSFSSRLGGTSTSRSGAFAGGTGAASGPGTGGAPPDAGSAGG